MTTQEKIAAEEQKEMNRRDRELRNARLRKLIDEGLPVSIINQRLGLLDKRRSMAELKRVCGWSPKS